MSANQWGREESMNKKYCSDCSGTLEFDEECGWFCPKEACGELGT